MLICILELINIEDEKDEIAMRLKHSAIQVSSYIYSLNFPVGSHMSLIFYNIIVSYTWQ
jgi:hypothetical protein